MWENEIWFEACLQNAYLFIVSDCCELAPEVLIDSKISCFSETFGDYYVTAGCYLLLFSNRELELSTKAERSGLKPAWARNSQGPLYVITARIFHSLIPRLARALWTHLLKNNFQYTRLFSSKITCVHVGSE